MMPHSEDTISKEAFSALYGETNWVLAEASLTNLIHLGLNAAFRNGAFGLPQWGVAGIATSTVISLSFGLCLTMIVVRFKLGVQLPWRSPVSQLRDRLRPILRIGLPSMFEPVSFQCAQLVMNVIVSSSVRTRSPPVST
jgi:Na+-driven multidrug efflux pump